MGVTLESTLASIETGVWTDIFFQGLAQKPIATNLAVYHDLSGATGKTVNFPAVATVAATKLADSATTTYATLSPTDTTATSYEIQASVELTRFAQATTPIKSPLNIVQTLMAALANQVETDLVAEACNGPADQVGSAVALTLATMRSARAVLGGWVNDYLGGWILSPTGEAALITDANLTQAAQYGAASVITEGAVAKLYGAPVYLSPFAPATKSAMVAKNTLHYGVLKAPTYDIQYSADNRSDKIVASTVVAVKYVPQSFIKGAGITHT